MSSTIPSQSAASRRAAHKASSRKIPPQADKPDAKARHQPQDTAEPIAPRDRTQIVRGRAGDHASVHQLLMAVFHGPSASEFFALQDEPLYEPTDRLLVKQQRRILAHLQMTKRVMHFGQLLLPASGILHLVTLPEYRRQGYATSLLKEADRLMRQDGAVLGMLRTDIPQFFQRSGWVVCGRHCHTTASARDILSRLEALHCKPANLLKQRERPLNIRLWRHVERDALMELYRQNTADTWGPLWRNEAYWRWLISRRAYDRIYAAIDGPDKFDLDQCTSRIVGYAVMKQGRILELMASPAHRSAPAQLLGRACADAIEHDHRSVRLDQPPGDPLHRLIQEAGGCFHYHESDCGKVFMLKLIDPIEFLARISPVLKQRRKTAGLPCNGELGLCLAGRKFRIVLDQQSVKLLPGKLGRSYLACDEPTFAQLLLGHLDVKDAAANGRIDVTTRVARQTAQALFPQLPWWRPTLDDLPA